MGADQHVDAVDLVQAEPIDRSAQIASAGRLGSGKAETLRRQRNSASQSEREALRHGRFLSAPGALATRPSG